MAITLYSSNLQCSTTIESCGKIKSPIFCANCGGIGHVYKNCNHPVTSYGIICFRLRKGRVPEYLMVQRKDSLSYVEFIRGKYSIEKKNYILSLVSNMTPWERENIRSLTFDQLWKSLWQAEDCKAYQKEYADAKAKFDVLRKGYMMKNDQNELYYFDFDYILNNTFSCLMEAEWGFPKGRRNINENDFSCAIREFHEETGMHPRYIRIIGNQKPFEEVFTGTNRIRYKHIYYLASCGFVDGNLYNPYNKIQSREIKDVKWFTYEEAQEKINCYNIERKELFRRVHQVITKNLCLNNNNNG